MNTNTAPHTHRFNDEQVCERCGATLAEVQAERAAAAVEVPTTRTAKSKAELDAAAKVNEKRIQASHRRARYERTGR